MKSFAVTLLIIAACFLGYDYFLAPPKDRVVFPRPADTPEASGTPKSPTPLTQTVVAPQAQPVSSSPFPAPPTRIPTTGPSKAAELNQMDSALVFHAPKLDSIEVLTGDWKKLPQSAFPRPVKLLKDTTFSLSFGASTVRAGAQVVALSMDNGLLMIAPSEASPVHKAVSIDDTDLRSTLIAVYERWKTERVEEARKKFEERLRQPKSSISATNPAVGVSGKPERSADGTYPLLLAKLRSGSPSDITPANIVRWGGAEMKSIKEIPTWTIDITYKTKTIFGEQTIETTAQVQKGQVVAWIYKGSGEPVP